MHIFAPMKTFLSIVTVSIAGFVGLGMVFSDVVPVPVIELDEVFLGLDAEVRDMACLPRNTFCIS